MNTEHVALFFHVLGALLFVSGIVVAGAAFESARRRSEAREIALLLGVTRIGVVLVAAGGLLVLAFGLWLVHLTGAGFGDAWVSAALALFVLASLLGAAGGRGPRRARVLAREGGEVAAIRRLLDDRRSRAANYASAAIVVAILALMIWQPGG